jgi:hypothetical protein
MKSQRLTRRLDVEELETRVVPSTSTNWSGYAIAANPGAVTAVIGSWVVPAVSGTGISYSSAWVGIDGDNSNTVEQIGTDSDLTNGRPTYYAWYEMYPADSVNLKMRVKPGDTVTAEVSYIGSNRLKLRITDGSQYFSITKWAAGLERSSAEWIQEAPSGPGVLPLANFHTIHFTRAQATINGITGPIDYRAWASAVDRINMVNNAGGLKASTGGLTDSASAATSSFSVSFISSANSVRNSQQGSWWWLGQPNQAMMQSSSPLSSVISRSANQPASSSAQTPLAFSPILPFGLSPVFTAGPVSTGGTMSLTAFLGTLAEQFLVLPAVLPANEIHSADASATSTGNRTVPLLPMPTPLDQPGQTGKSAQSRLWAPAPEPAPALKDQPEVERTAPAQPSSLVFGLFLLGALGMVKERAGREIRL